MMNRVRVSIAAAAALLMSCPPPPAPDACLGRVAGDLVISEVMLDPEGTDTGGEWIELFNTLGTPLDLKGLTLYVRDTDGSGAKTHAIRAGTAPARGYFVASTFTISLPFSLKSRVAVPSTLQAPSLTPASSHTVYGAFRLAFASTFFFVEPLLQSTDHLRPTSCLPGAVAMLMP